MFMGFPPRAGEARQDWFMRLKEEPRTVVFFESPHRIRRTLTDLEPFLVKRHTMVARELTKVHEQLVDSPNHGSMITELGEFTVVVGPSSEPEREPGAGDVNTITDVFGRLTNSAGFDEPTAIVLTATALTIPSRTIAKIIKKNRILAKQQNR